MSEGVAIVPPTMAAAVFGLLGVIVGGLLTFATDALVDARGRRRETRASARILQDELDWWAACVERARQQSNVLELRDVRSVRPLWDQLRSSLADLPRDTWNRVQYGVLSTEALLGVDEVGQRPHDEAHPGFSERLFDDLGESVERVRSASEALAPFTR